ncbi:hypothetical protein LTR10_006050 [Elasticomyces elasticus]|nr:hypothetical protein LTR10_006050 [Elasticomyces elasticus]KAK4966893.1 hypothetical protein LTR42_011207 [Elasticomyces elasticus]
MPVPVQVAYKAIGKPEVGVNNYQGFMPGKTNVLRKGWSRDGAKALESDIRIDHDVEIKVRDGCRLYLDIYRPADFPEKIPIIIGWSCYGKNSHQEWYELYCDKHADAELHAYFDRFLKGLDNDFESSTPKVRWSALQFGDREAIDNIVYTDFPIPSTEYREMFLHKDGLKESPANAATTAVYDSENGKSHAAFNHTFAEKTRLVGLPKAILYMSCLDHNDMNVYVILRKLDKEGKALMHLCFPLAATPVKSIAEIPEAQRQSTNLHMGSVGILRASHRAFDAKKSIHPQFPFHPHEIEEKIKPGDVVKLEIGIWAMGNDFDAGESISVQVSGQMPIIAEYSAFSEARPAHELNKGQHRIHIGPKNPSSIILPFVPL